LKTVLPGTSVAHFPRAFSQIDKKIFALENQEKF